MNKFLPSLGLLAALLSTPLGALFAQAPPPVPALPDSERRTQYSISASTCACSVGFALFGTSTDVDQWLEVWVAGTRYLSTDPSHGWALTSATGTLATIPRPITDAVLTFTAVQTGIVQIVGAERPRRSVQVQENQGVPARAFNQAITDLVAQNRETWDKINDVTGRGFFAPPGSTGGIITGPLTGVINSLGPFTSGHFAVWNGSSGASLTDGGAPLGVSVTNPLYGAKGDGTTDDTAAILSAMAAVPSGGRLEFPAGTYLVSCGAGTQIFLRTTPINIIGAGAAATTIKVASGVAGTCDVFHFAPTGSSVLSNWRVADLSITAQSGTPARYGFNIDTTNVGNPQIQGLIIERISVGQLGGARAIYVNNSIANANGGTYNSIFRDNVLSGSIYLNNAGDSIRVLNNIITGAPFFNNTNIGVYVNLIAGAGGTEIIGNNITASGGAVIIDAAASPIIAFNEIEHVSNLADANNAIVDISGAVSTVAGAQVVYNQIQYPAAEGVGSPIPLRIDHASNTHYDGNRFGLPAAYVPVVNTANATGTVIGAANWYFNTSATLITDSGSGTLYEVALAPVSGGVIGATSATQPAYSAALTSHGFVLGGGAGATPTATAECTTGKVPTGVTSAVPTCQSLRQAMSASTSGATSAGLSVQFAIQTLANPLLGAPLFPFAGTIKNFYFATNTAPGAGKNFVVTVFVGTYGSAAATTLTCTINGASATSCNDTTHSVTVTAGQEWFINVAADAASATSTGMGAGFELDNP